MGPLPIIKVIGRVAGIGHLLKREHIRILWLEKLSEIYDQVNKVDITFSSVIFLVVLRYFHQPIFQALWALWYSTLKL